MNLNSHNIDFFLLGRSLPHTLSPQIHELLFSLTGRSAEYGICECERDELPEVYDSVLKNKQGYNVTIPYKCDICRYLDGLDGTAELCDAVNCVKNQDGRAIGYNTDIVGFTRSLESNGIELGGRVLLLGYGGAGKMMAAAALQAGARLTVADLTLPDLSELCHRLYKSADACTLDSIVGSFDLCINATPVGMFPKVRDCPVSEEIIANCGAVFDAVYNPKETVFLKIAREHGIKGVSGMEMLVIQAAQSHTIWYGAQFTKQQLDDIVEKVRALL